MKKLLPFCAGLTFGLLIGASCFSNEAPALEPHKAIVSDGERLVIWIDGLGYAMPTQAEMWRGDCGEYTSLHQYDGLPVCVIE